MCGLGNQRATADDWFIMHTPQIPSRSGNMVLRRVALASGLVIASVGAFAATAGAHVTINPSEVPAGGFAVVRFQVPNESDTASTVKVEIAMPEGVVIPFVLVKAEGDWKATTERTKLATPVKTEYGELTEVVSKVTFEGGAIAPGHFEIFDIQLGPLPDTAGEVLAFPTIQTYDNGDVSRWIDRVVEGQPGPEAPTPLLALGEAGDDHHSSSSASDDSHSDSDSDSHALGIVGIVLGALGTTAGAAALVRTRRKA